jgi:hypothetical protein
MWKSMIDKKRKKMVVSIKLEVSKPQVLPIDGGAIEMIQIPPLKPLLVCRMSPNTSHE